jgi:hypothetical protein
VIVDQDQPLEQRTSKPDHAAIGRALARGNVAPEMLALVLVRDMQLYE